MAERVMIQEKEKYPREFLRNKCLIFDKHETYNFTLFFF